MNAKPLQLDARPTVSEAPPAALAIDAQQAAKMLGVCPETILREIRRGKLRCVKIGRCVRIRLKELQDYMERSERAAGEPLEGRRDRR